MNVTSLDPIWVPGVASKRGRSGSPGPNGEPANSGSWKLAHPVHGIYVGPTISPSALDTASECVHKWALSRLDDLERPPNHKADLGNLCHTELESWLVHGVQPTIDGMAKVLTHFPMPGRCESECQFGFVVEHEGHEVVFAGFMDARQRPGVVYDLKTTGSFDWKKTPAQLAANLQGAVYALDEIARSSVSAVELRWVYALLRETASGIQLKQVETTSVTVTRAQAEAVLVQYLPMAVLMLDAIDEKQRAADMPKNMEACHGYGGCGWKIAGGSVGPKGQLPSVSAKLGEPCCVVPAGGGFMSMLAQDRERLGVVSEKKMLVHIAKQKRTQPRVEEKSMSMGSRFGINNNNNVVNEAVVTAVVAAVKPSGMAARFAKTTAAPEAERAKTEGVSAKGTPAQAAASGTLLSRLQNLVKINPIATGINPADAAPEWTQEQQAEEGDKLNKKDAKPTVEVAAPVKRGRGRPPKAQTPVQTPAVQTPAVRSGQLGTLEAATVQMLTSVAGALGVDDVQTIDAIAKEWLTSGNRRGAILLLQAIETTEQ